MSCGGCSSTSHCTQPRSGPAADGEEGEGWVVASGAFNHSWVPYLTQAQFQELVHSPVSGKCAVLLHAAVDGHRLLLQELLGASQAPSSVVLPGKMTSTARSRPWSTCVWSPLQCRPETTAQTDMLIGMTQQWLTMAHLEALQVKTYLCSP